MKRKVVWIVFWALILGTAFLVASAYGTGADVFFNGNDFRLAPVTNRSVIIVPLALAPVPGKVSNYDPNKYSTGTNGTFWISNMVEGTYQGEILVPPRPTRFLFYIDPTNAVQVIGDQTIASVRSTYPPQSVSWSIAASDLRYLRASDLEGAGANIFTNDGSNIRAVHPPIGGILFSNYPFSIFTLASSAGTLQWINGLITDGTATTISPSSRRLNASNGAQVLNWSDPAKVLVYSDLEANGNGIIDGALQVIGNAVFHGAITGDGSLLSNISLIGGPNNLTIAAASLATNLVQVLNPSGLVVFYIGANKAAYFDGTLTVNKGTDIKGPLTVEGGLSLQKAADTPPGNTTVPVAWLDMTTTNGTAYKLPLYQ